MDKKISLDFIKNTLQEKGFQIEEEVLTKVEEMIFKEENIMIPMLMEKLT
jgi:DUF438 domain-containing protein